MAVGDIYTYTPSLAGRLNVMSNNGTKMVPGSIVIFRGLEKSTEGIVVGTDESNSWVTVLWHKWPDIKDVFTIPNIRNMKFQPISQYLTSVQPMTVPVGGIFYLDYQYGSDSMSGSNK